MRVVSWWDGDDFTPEVVEEPYMVSPEVEVVGLRWSSEIEVCRKVGTKMVSSVKKFGDEIPCFC